ncbi:NACHT domain-containing protein [Streptomyces sp. NPDC002536]
MKILPRYVVRSRSPRGGPTYNTLDGTTVYGMVVQAGTVTVGVPPSTLQATLDDAAGRLADSLRKQWRSEEQRWRVQDPIPLPVRWQAAPDELTDHWSNVCRCPAGHDVPRPVSLAGRLDEIVDVYRRVPSGRLVVLGRAGSGKSILTVRFALDLLGPPGTSVTVVPVIFSLGSWNPVRPLGEWLAARLERDHPGLAAAAGPGPSSLAGALVDNDRILPVLDGFDEIADGLHRPALEALNTTAMPLLLTSRRTEYAAAVTGTDVLTSAAAVELSDLSLADLEDYLPRTTRKASAGVTAWDPVLGQLRDHPENPASERLATVLRTPLMVTLARTSYSDTPDRTPADLLDADRFGTPQALEDHLLDNFIPTVYGDQPPERRERVLHWFGYLARHLEQLGTRDLAWWQLGTTMGYFSRMLVVGLTIGLASALAVGGLGIEEGPAQVLVDALVNGTAMTLVFGLVHGFVPWLATKFRFGGAVLKPSRMQVQIRGGMGRMREDFAPRLVSGLGIGLVFGVLFGLAQGVAGVFWFKFFGGLVLVGPFLLLWLAIGIGAGLAFGVVYGAMAGLEVPVDIRSSVSPSELLATNCRTVLVQLSVAGIVFGSVYGLARGVGFGEGLVPGLLNGIISGLEVALGYGLSLTAWGRWVVLGRIALPLAGRLPWSVCAFLEDAHCRGVLRQAGAVHQFRHARLQDRLSERRPG